MDFPSFDDKLFSCEVSLIDSPDEILYTLNFPISEEEYDDFISSLAEEHLFDLDEDSEFTFSYFIPLNNSSDCMDEVIDYFCSGDSIDTSISSIQDDAILITEQLEDVDILCEEFTFNDVMLHLEREDYTIYRNTSLEDIAEQFLDEEVSMFLNSSSDSYAKNLVKLLYEHIDLESYANYISYDYIETSNAVIRID